MGQDGGVWWGVRHHSVTKKSRLPSESAKGKLPYRWDEKVDPIPAGIKLAAINALEVQSRRKEVDP